MLIKAINESLVSQAIRHDWEFPLGGQVIDQWVKSSARESQCAEQENITWFWGRLLATPHAFQTLLNKLQFPERETQKENRVTCMAVLATGKFYNRDTEPPTPGPGCSWNRVLTDRVRSVNVHIHATKARLKQDNEEMQMRKGINIFQHREFAGNCGDHGIAASPVWRQEAKGRVATIRTRGAK